MRHAVGGYCRSQARDWRHLQSQVDLVMKGRDSLAKAVLGYPVNDRSFRTGEDLGRICFEDQKQRSFALRLSHPLVARFPPSRSRLRTIARISSVSSLLNKCSMFIEARDVCTPSRPASRVDAQGKR
jgi:hypothetical protein